MAGFRLAASDPSGQRQAFNKGGYRDWASRIRARLSCCRRADATALRLRQRITAGDHRQFRHPSERARAIATRISMAILPSFLGFAGRTYMPEAALPEEMTALHKALKIQRG